MDYEQKYLKYKQKYLKMLNDQKGGEPFLSDIATALAYLWLFLKNRREFARFYQRQLPIPIPIPLQNIILTPRHRVHLIPKSGLSVLLVRRLFHSRSYDGLQFNRQLMGRVLSRILVVKPIAPPPCVTTITLPESPTFLALHPRRPVIVSGDKWQNGVLWDFSIQPPVRNQIAILRGLDGDRVRRDPFTRDPFSRDRRQPVVIPGLVSAAAFHPGAPFLTTSSSDHHLKIWNCSNPNTPLLLEEGAGVGHNRTVTSIAFHSDPGFPFMASGSYDRTVKLWNCLDPSKHTFTATIPKGADHVLSVAFHPREPILASATGNNVIFHDCSNPKSPVNMGNLTDATRVIFVAFHPNPILHLLATVSDDSTVKLWDCRNIQTQAPNCVATIEQINVPVNDGNFHPTLPIAFHPTLPILAICSGSNVKLLNCLNPQSPTLVTTLSGHYQDVVFVAFHPSLPRLVTGEADGYLKIWNL
jgi:WD40 repeat protein